jgi:hypothetical protein
MVVTGNVTASSDVALKDDIRPLMGALEMVLNLRGVRYERKSTGRTEIGLVAQEVEGVVPEVVFDGDTKSVAYGNIVAVLIEAIKELAAEVRR